jgi:AcrR family transcriptional regulator
MARWEPDARGRLLRAALDLFAEHGYDATTAAQIAERAGLTKTTLFRQFADKREIVFQGQEALVALATGGVEGAPAGSEPLDVLRTALVALCSVHSDEQHEIGRRLEPILAASTELRERAVAKRSAITDALHRALAARLGDTRQAGILADMGIRAYYEGFDLWVASPGTAPLADTVTAELHAYAVALSRALRSS